MRWLSFVLLIALGGCSGSSKDTSLSPTVPSDYRQKVLLAVSEVFADPTNIKDAFISDPMQVPVDNVQRDAVCVRGNPRDLNTKQYLGSRELVAYFFGGGLNQLIPAQPGQCAKAPYKPFPELEKYCRGEKCL